MSIQENNQEFMRTRPILPLVLSMAYPMVLSMMVNSLYNIIDSFYVAKISENAMTALSLVFPAQNLINAVTVGFGIGINAVISYNLGMREKERADAAASAGIALSLLHGIVLAILCIGCMRPFLSRFTSDGDLIRMGIAYSNIVFLFCPLFAVAISFEKIFQAVGMMKVSMVSMLAGCVVNIILDPLMIFGVGFFPKMNIEGAALATGIGQVTTLLLYVVIYIGRKKKVGLDLSLRGVGKAKGLVSKCYGVGIPATLNLALPSIMVSVLNGTLAAYSQAYVLVLGAYYKLQTFLYLTANGIVQGMRPICGYNYGAGEWDRVKKIIRTGLVLIGIVMAVGTLLCLGIPEALIGMFTETAQTVQLGARALRIISMGFLASTFSVTISGVLEGIGKGKESLVISMIRYVVVLLPLAICLSRLTGPEGVWHAFWITELISALVSLLQIKRQGLLR